MVRLVSPPKCRWIIIRTCSRARSAVLILEVAGGGIPVVEGEVGEGIPCSPPPRLVMEVLEVWGCRRRRLMCLLGVRGIRGLIIKEKKNRKSRIFFAPGWCGMRWCFRLFWGRKGCWDTGAWLAGWMAGRIDERRGRLFFFFFFNRSPRGNKTGCFIIRDQRMRCTLLQQTKPNHRRFTFGVGNGN